MSAKEATCGVLKAEIFDNIPERKQVSKPYTFCAEM